VVFNLEKGPMTFRYLQYKCGGISPSILNQRIKDLKEADVVERTLQGYQLTARGEELRLCLLPLGQWSFQWAEDLFQCKKEL
jgi:DNA-binding HxlR family transcriptional regulator